MVIVVYILLLLLSSTPTIQSQVMSSPLCGTWQSYSGELIDPIGLTSVSLRSSNDVWVVGSKHSFFYLDNPKSLVQHWDGKAWRDVSPPSPDGGRAFYLRGVSLPPSNGVWVVGNSDSQALDGKTFAAWWNGERWETKSTPNPGTKYNSIDSVVALSSNDAWAVGYYEDDTFSTYPLILHWDGTKWGVSTVVPIRGLILQSITALSPNDAWAVGGNVVLHWDGLNWKQVITPLSSSVNAHLRSVVAINKRNIWVVGDSKIISWDGSIWTFVANPMGEGYGQLWSVSASNKDVWVVGSKDNQALALSWDGTRWSAMKVPQSKKMAVLEGVGVDPNGEVWAAGQTGDDNYGFKYSLMSHFVEKPCP